MLTIDLPEDIERRLIALASRTARSVSDHVHQALIAYLGDLEDLLAAEEEIAALRCDETTTIPLAEMMKRYGLSA